METLKEFSDIMQPDERQKYFAIFDNLLNKDRPLELKDVYFNAVNIKLHNGVPEKIRNHFATAQNLLIYSWFFYPFNVTAEFIAYVTLEFALKERFKPKKETSFKHLVSKAVQNGYVKDEGFSHIQEQREERKLLRNEIGTVSQQVKEYTEILIDIIPYFRNELAHGSEFLHNSGAVSVRICAEFINQLFQEKGMTS